MTTNKKTILLVDDEEGTRKHIRNALERSGHTVLTAKDFDDAVETYHRHRGGIDLLLTDVALPGLSGCDLAIALREEDPALRVLLTSGYTGAELLQFYGVHLTDVHFLQKPFRLADLLQRVALVFERFGSASA
jgi:DNA-binding response OmpR family regulator